MIAVNPLLAAVSISVAAAGCAFDDGDCIDCPPSDGPDGEPPLQPIDELETLTFGDDAGESVCECATEACIRAWIIENFGCDICVVVVCGDGLGGGCARCDQVCEAGCTTDDDCGDGEYCAITECGDAVGHCAEASAICTGDDVPFCGCDGETFYSSSTCPWRPYVHAGACP